MIPELSDDARTTLKDLIKRNGVVHTVNAVAFLLEGGRKDGLTNLYDRYPLPHILRMVGEVYEEQQTKTEDGEKNQNVAKRTRRSNNKKST